MPVRKPIVIIGGPESVGIVVQKFGGTSVGSAVRIENVAKLVEAELKLNNQVVVVVSAMAGITDSLVRLANSVAGSDAAFNSNEYDVVLSSGEIVSAGLLALALNKLNIKAKSFQGWQIPIQTDGRFNEAKILDIDTKELVNCLAQGVVPVVCGFQGVYESCITTLGRGGSDTTAVAIASALQAKVCDIYTDVDGIYSIDPNAFSSSRKVDMITYDEIISLSYAGAKVLHPRAAEIAKRYDIEIRVRSSFENDFTGTSIRNYEEKMEKATVTAITTKDNQALLSVKSNAGFTDILKDLRKVNYSIETFTLDNMLISAANDDIAELKVSLGEKLINVDQDLTKVTIVGYGVKRNNIIVEKVFQIIQNQGISVIQSAITDVSISMYVAGMGKEIAQALHNGLI